MNSGQAMMVIVAMMLLSTFTLTVNNTLVLSTSTGLEMEASLDALSYGHSLLDEILQREFDEATIGTRIFNTSDLSTTLGWESGEAFGLPDSSESDVFLSRTSYDDVDDYNHYRRVVRNPRLDYFTLTVSVLYVEEDSPFSDSGSKTFCKKVQVTVTNPYMPKDQNGVLVPLTLSDMSVYRRYF
ncbi:MAG: hypothetical protein ABIH23_10200 [bacterium]